MARLPAATGPTEAHRLCSFAIRSPILVVMPAPELPGLCVIGEPSYSRQRRRWSAILASYTWQGERDMTVTIDAVGMGDVKQAAEALVPLSVPGGSGERPTGDEKGS